MLRVLKVWKNGVRTARVFGFLVLSLLGSV